MASPRCLRCKVKNLNNREFMQGYRNQSRAIIGNCIVKSLSQADYTHLRTDFRFWSLLIPVEKLFINCTAEQKPIHFQSTYIYSHFTPNVLLPVMYFHINSSSSFIFYFYSPVLLTDANKNPSQALFCLVKQASFFLITCDWKDALVPLIILFTQGSQFQLDSSLLKLPELYFILEITLYSRVNETFHVNHWKYPTWYTLRLHLFSLKP